MQFLNDLNVVAPGAGMCDALDQALDAMDMHWWVTCTPLASPTSV